MDEDRKRNTGLRVRCNNTCNTTGVVDMDISRYAGQFRHNRQRCMVMGTKNIFVMMGLVAGEEVNRDVELWGHRCYRRGRTSAGALGREMLAVYHPVGCQ